MSDRFPHVREPSSGEPDICIYCREEWVDLLTLYERDECSVRLRAEVERLRDTVAFLRACVPPTHPSEYGHEAWTAALVEAKKEGARSTVAERAAERAAVVAWLRDEVDASMKMRAPVRAATFLRCAEAIECGEHRREEMK